MTKTEALKVYFGFSSFREGQSEIIDNLLDGRDVLAVLPTGSGKSICYEIPAILNPGLTIVVSPLISLMQDQVKSLTKRGISVCTINSSQTTNNYLKSKFSLESGECSLCYVSPEKLTDYSLISTCNALGLSMIAVDEAHCISQWGHDFRPAYMNIPKFIFALDKRPVVGAFTATATSRVRDEIADVLKLNHPFVINSGAYRPNLAYSVIRTYKKQEALIELIHERSNRSGIVFTQSRAVTDSLTSLFTSLGFSCDEYHAGMTRSKRKQSQARFLEGKTRIMFATSAFGMGIDKSDIDFVIHYGFPLSVEQYFQEAGRGGRGGQKCDCILIFNDYDYTYNSNLIMKGSPGIAQFDKRHVANVKRSMRLLDSLMDYVNCPDKNRFLSEYFK